MRLRDIEVGADYAVTLPRKLPLTDAERWQRDQNPHPFRSLDYDDAFLRYSFPVGQHHAYGFRATVVAKGVPSGKTTQGVTVTFTYRTKLDDDAPEATDTRTIHTSRVLEPWADFEARQLQRDMDSLDRHPYSRYGCNVPGCPEVYDHQRIQGPLGYLWYCPGHQPDTPIREEDLW